MGSLKQKTIIVTGAKSGIGKAVALLLGERGANVIVNYNQKKEDADDVVLEIARKGSKAVAVKADVTKKNEVEEMIKKTLDAFGSVDGLVNNAGVSITHELFENSTWEEYERHFEVQVHGTYNMIQTILPQLKKKGGSVVNIVTEYTFGAPPKQLGGYITAKYGLLGLTKVLAQELGKYKVRVNAVSPGMTETDLTKDLPRIMKEMNAKETPLGQNIEPIDVAKAVAFLLSDNARFITGVNLPVNGGRSL